MKKGWALLLCAFVGFAASGRARGTVFGDLTGDARVTIADATQALQITVGTSQPGADRLRAGDVAPVAADGTFGDGKITIGDVVRLLQRSVGVGPTEGWPGLRSYLETLSASGTLPLSTRFPILSVRSDLTHDFRLVGGFRLTGQVAGVTAPSWSTLFVLDNENKGVVLSSLSAAGNYAVGVPVGDYRFVLSRRLTLDGRTPPGEGGQGTPDNPPDIQMNHVDVAVPLADTTTVRGDTVRILGEPALPPLYPLHGHILVPGGFAPPYGLTLRQISDLDGNPTVFYGHGAQIATEDGNYAASVPAGVYYAEISLAPHNFETAAFIAPISTPIRITGPTEQNMTAELLPWTDLFGEVILPTGDVPDRTGMVIAINTDSTVSEQASQSHAIIIEGKYDLPLIPGTYDLSTSVSGSSSIGPGDQGNWSIMVRSVPVPEMSTQDIVFPKFPTERVKITGRVLNPAGGPLPNGSVGFFSTRLDNAAPGLQFSAYQLVTPEGDFTLSLPPGDYEVSVPLQPTLHIPTNFADGQ